MLAIGTYLDSSAQRFPQILSSGQAPCLFTRHMAVELGYPAISLLYGRKPSLPFGESLTHCPVDFLAFFFVIYVTLRSNMWQFRISGLFRTVVCDTTHYFLVIFTSHLALELTLIFGTVRIISYFPPHLLTETVIASNPTTPRIVSDDKIPLPPVRSPG